MTYTRTSGKNECRVCKRRDEHSHEVAYSRAMKMVRESEAIGKSLAEQDDRLIPAPRWWRRKQSIARSRSGKKGKF